MLTFLRLGRTALVTLPWMAVLLGAEPSPPRQDGPPARPAVRGRQSPSEEAAVFHLDPGLRVELAASEPQVESPVAMAFDESGRLWVVEMLDYPNGPAPGGGPEGRVKVLEDRDEDGFYEHATVFADGLLFANGLIPWKDGAIVTAAPSILYLADTDGDGKADRREVLYEGFATANPQLRVSHPVLGPDGWIYVANGLRGGKIRRASQPEAKPVDLSGRDFRFDPVLDRAEAVAGMGQFGNTFDDWGHRFVCTNRNHLIPIVLEDRYTRRNPYLVTPGPARGDQGSGGAARIYPLSSNETTSALHAGTFTAACSVTVYRGDLLGEPYRGSAFTCDPTGNLVHQEVLLPEGASFRGRPSREGVEFLASPDGWTRPVFLAHGPDGALYMVDMYRAVIEHPQWMPRELRDRPDLLLGKHKGRIWRIVPKGLREPRPRPNLGDASTAELVGLLGHSDVWWRTTAQRLLLQRHDPAALGPLRELARESDRLLARYHSAWLLEHAGALDEELILDLMEADHPCLREAGVLLAESRLAHSEALQDRVCALAEDRDARVRFQAALSLGEWDDDRILGPLARIALAGADDRWTRLAVASAVPERAGALTETLLARPFLLASRPDPGRLALLRELASVVGARRDPKEVGGVLEALQSIDTGSALRWRIAGLLGLADGLGRRGGRLGEFLAGLPDSSVSDRAKAMLAEAADVAADTKNDLAERLDAVRLLAHAPWEVAGPALTRLLTDDPAQAVRLSAVGALASFPKPEASEAILAPWKSYLPAVRREATQALLARPGHALALLDEVDAGRIARGDIDAAGTRRLTNHPKPEVRDRARELLGHATAEGRQQVIQRYRGALDLDGDVDRGRAVFGKQCATCHRVDGVGVPVGPDISDLRAKTREQILGDVLDPNAAIDANYVSYTVATSDGRIFSGLVASETSSSVVLRRAEGQTDEVLRQDIEELRSDGTSLMPEGLEQEIGVEEMADLLTFLKGWRRLGE